jgi:hypothetical protein
MPRITFPTYRRANLNRAYPFDDASTRTNGEVTIGDDVFVDGFLHPIGADAELHISSIRVKVDSVVVSLSDGAGPVGTGTFVPNAIPDLLTFTDDYSRPIGVLVPYADGLKKIAGWSENTYQFLSTQTRFAATVYAPQPQRGVRGVVLPSGALFAGDVKLVGERGVQLTNYQAPAGRSDLDSLTVASNEIRVDIVGDPLFNRRSCEDFGESFEAVRLLQTINGVGADANGDFKITVGNTDISNPALRVRVIENGLSIGFIE